MQPPPAIVASSRGKHDVDWLLSRSFHNTVCTSSIRWQPLAYYKPTCTHHLTPPITATLARAGLDCCRTSTHHRTRTAGCALRAQPRGRGSRGCAAQQTPASPHNMTSTYTYILLEDTALGASADHFETLPLPVRLDYLPGQRGLHPTPQRCVKLRVFSATTAYTGQGTRVFPVLFPGPFPSISSTQRHVL